MLNTNEILDLERKIKEKGLVQMMIELEKKFGVNFDYKDYEKLKIIYRLYESKKDKTKYKI